MRAMSATRPVAVRHAFMRVWGGGSKSRVLNWILFLVQACFRVRLTYLGPVHHHDRSSVPRGFLHNIRTAPWSTRDLLVDHGSFSGSARCTGNRQTQWVSRQDAVLVKRHCAGIANGRDLPSGNVSVGAWRVTDTGQRLPGSFTLSSRRGISALCHQLIQRKTVF